MPGREGAPPRDGGHPAPSRSVPRACVGPALGRPVLAAERGHYRTCAPPGAGRGSATSDG